MEDREGELTTTYSIKVSGYMSSDIKPGIAIAGQPAPHPYFHRPLHKPLGAGFAAGMRLDALEERAFPAGHPSGSMRCLGAETSAKFLPSWSPG
jgi:hypothetical protein